MGLISKIDITGTQKDPDYNLSGTLTGVNKDLNGMLSSVGAILSGTSSIPKVLDRTAIHYDTTEAWNSDITIVAQRGHLYIYNDYTSAESEDGTVVYYPAIKIGDGSSYLIDLPFSITGIDHDILEEHINNYAIHVSNEDRADWDSKISASVNGEILKFDQRG